VQRRFHSRNNERNDEKLSVTFYKLPSLKRATNKKERAQRETALGMLPALFSRSAEIKELSRTCWSDDNDTVYISYSPITDNIPPSRDVARNALRINSIIPGGSSFVGITACFLLPLFNQPLFNSRLRDNDVPVVELFGAHATLTAARSAYAFSVISSTAYSPILPNRAQSTPNRRKARIVDSDRSSGSSLAGRKPLVVSRLILWHTLHAP